MSGEEVASRAHEARWRNVIDRHGLGWLGATHELTMGNLETWAGDPERGERRLREARDILAALGNVIGGKMPLVVETSSEWDILRADAIAREFNINGTFVRLNAEPPPFSNYGYRP